MHKRKEKSKLKKIQKILDVALKFQQKKLCMHKVQKVYRNYSPKTFWSTFLVQLCEMFCCLYAPAGQLVQQAAVTLWLCYK